MKIGIYHNLPSGGALYHLDQVVRQLKQEGHELILITPETAEKDFKKLSQVTDQHICTPREPWKPAKRSPLNPFLYRQYLEGCIANEKLTAQTIAALNLDGLYLGQCQTWTEPPLLKFLPPELPTVLYCQEPKRAFHEERFIQKRQAWPWWKKLWRLPTIQWMQNEMQNNILKAQLVLCNSEFSRNNILKAYPKLPKERLRVSYIGTSTTDFQPDPQKLSHKHRQLISVGALDPSKNHGFAIEVAGTKPKGEAFHVAIVADRDHGHTADELKQQAQQLGVKLQIHVRVSTEELKCLYQDSFACVYTPLMEPFGIVSIESQACGTPVLGADEGGIKETLLDHVGGLKLPRNPMDFKKAIEHWLDNPSEYAKTSKLAREHILQHWDRPSKISETCKTVIEHFQSSKRHK